MSKSKEAKIRGQLIVIFFIIISFGLVLGLFVLPQLGLYSITSSNVSEYQEVDSYWEIKDADSDYTQLIIYDQSISVDSDGNPVYKLKIYGKISHSSNLGNLSYVSSTRRVNFIMENLGNVNTHALGSFSIELSDSDFEGLADELEPLLDYPVSVFIGEYEEVEDHYISHTMNSFEVIEETGTLTAYVITLTLAIEEG